MAINQKTLSRMDELKGISLSDGLFTGVIGVSKIDSSESGNKIEIDDPLTYLIGSLTKIFIADIFYILEKDLNLNLDRKINEFIIIPEKFNKITLKVLRSTDPTPLLA